MKLNYYTTTELFDDYLTHYTATDKAGIDYEIINTIMNGANEEGAAPTGCRVTIQTEKENVCAIEYLYKCLDYAGEWELYLDDMISDGKEKIYLDITSFGCVGDDEKILKAIEEIL